MFKRIGFSSALVFTALGLLQGSALAAERFDGHDRDQKAFVQNDRGGKFSKKFRGDERARRESLKRRYESRFRHDRDFDRDHDRDHDRW